MLALARDTFSYPTLALNSGGTATLTNGSNFTDTLDFAYTVSAGENSSDLDYTATTALSLNGDTIISAGGNATLSLPPTGTDGLAATDIQIDTVAPTVTMTTPADNSTTDNQPTLSAISTDNTGGSGVASVQFQYSSDGGMTWANVGAPALGPGPVYTVAFPSALAFGTYQARAVATDYAGNSSPDSPYSSVSTLAFPVVDPNNLTSTTGSLPDDLIVDASGNLFGSTQAGGPFAGGTVFEIAAGSRTVTVLASFNFNSGTNVGGNPRSLYLDASGTLFGFAQAFSGSALHQTLWKLTPGSPAATLLASDLGGWVDPSGASANALVAQISADINSGRESPTTDSSGNHFSLASGGWESDSVGNSYPIVWLVEQTAGGSTITLASFDQFHRGYYPISLLVDPQGNIWGPAQDAPFNALTTGGLIYELKPNPPVSIVTFTVDRPTQNFAPVVTLDPENQTVDAGGRATFTAAASDGNPTPTRVQWYFSGDDGQTYRYLTDGGSYSGATTPTLTITGVSRAANGNLYYAKFYNVAGFSDTTTPATLTVDFAPTVTSITRASASPTNASSVQFTVSFSENVTGVAPSDFTLFTTGTVGGTIDAVTGSGSVYTVTVDNLSGTGTLRLDVPTGSTIQDVDFGNPLGAAFTTGEVYTIDHTPPTVTSIVRRDPVNSPTNATSVTMRVTFSEGVQNVDAADFTSSFGSVNAVFQVSPSTYDVQISGLDIVNGTLTLAVSGTATIQDLVGNSLIDPTPTGTVESYLLDHIPPTVISITRASPNPTPAGVSVQFTVTFSEYVQGPTVTTTAFSLTTAGPVGTIADVTGVNNVYTVTVDNVSGSGTLRLDVPDSGPILDLAGNALTPGFTGAAYTVVPPIPTIVYVDSNWAGTTVGKDPVGGLSFGFNAFADIPSAINKVAVGGTVVIFGGSYPAAVTVNKALQPIEVSVNPLIPAATTVTISGAVTLGVNTTFVEMPATAAPQSTAANLVFGSTVNDAAAGTASLTIAGSLLNTFNAVVGGSQALSVLTIGAGGTTIIGTAALTTSGNQTFNDPIILHANTTLTSTGHGTITVASTVSGAFTLTVNTGGASNYATLPVGGPGTGTASQMMLASPTTNPLANVQPVANPSPDDTPAGASFPIGFFDFTVRDLLPGAATTVTLTLPLGVEANSYFMYNPTPDNPSPHWFNFTFDGSTGATFGTDAEGRVVITLHFIDGQRGDGDLLANGLIVDPGAPVLLTTHYLVTGADAGGEPLVRVFDAASGAETFSFLAYDPSFSGGVRVAVGDVNGDGIPDIITGAGPGGVPTVKVFSGRDGSLLYWFCPFEASFTGGVYVAAGDVNGDGYTDIVVGKGAGGVPEVKVFGGGILGGQQLYDFLAYDAAFRGGVTVAAGDVNGDGYADLITGVASGAPPWVKVFGGGALGGKLLQSYCAFNPLYVGGVFVAAGDVNGDGHADILAGSGGDRLGSGPQVRIFSGADGSELQSVIPFDAAFVGGARVAAVEVDGRADLVIGAGPLGGPQVRVLDALSLVDLDSFFAFAPFFRGGVFVGGG